MSDMVVIRHRRKDNFTVLNNAVICDERLSFKATGLWAYLMYLPEGWKLHLSHLKTVKADGKHSLRTGVAELKRFGYISIESDRLADGRFDGTTWLLTDTPPSIPGEAEQ